MRNIKIYILIVLVFVLLFIYYCTNKKLSFKSNYDIVIVGAGLSGLTCGYSFKDADCLILEKENYAGGRVYTKQFFNEYYYDAGAIFSFDTEILFNYKFNFNREKYFFDTGKIGFYFSDELFLEDSPEKCLKNSTLSSEIINELLEYKKRQIHLSKNSLKIANAFFNTVYPGKFEDAIYERQLDIFQKWNISRFENGHQSVINKFVEPLKKNIRLNCEVTSIKDLGNKVEIEFYSENKKYNIFSKIAIVSTPAPVTNKIVKNINPATKKFLEKIEYGKFVVSSFLVENVKHNFSYIVTPEKLCDSIYKINYPDKKYSVLLVYYCNESSTKIWNYKPKEINRLSEKFICEILNIDNKDIIDSDIIKWKNGCNYITYNAYNNFHKNYLCATKNIFLTGDYFFWEKHYKLPLGMAAAVFSGQQTSFLIKMMKAY